MKGLCSWLPLAPLLLGTLALASLQRYQGWKDEIDQQPATKSPFCRDGKKCTKLISYYPGLSMQQLLENDPTPMDHQESPLGGLQTGENAVLIVVNGSQIKAPGMLWRGPSRHKWIDSSDESSERLIPVHAAHLLGQALEHFTSGHLPRFHIETKHFPHCRNRNGPCAVWEAGSGKIVLHKGLLLGDVRGGQLNPKLHWSSRFVEGLASYLSCRNPNSSIPITNSTWSFRHQQSTYLAEAARFALFKSYVDGDSNRMIFGENKLPFWWCLACPIALGSLVPLVLNYGLTEIADEICVALELSDQECADLWWGAFSIALILSLGSAIPIVYACGLPECGR